jgi:uncharacterized protein YjdB
MSRPHCLAPVFASLVTLALPFAACSGDDDRPIAETVAVTGVALPGTLYLTVGTPKDITATISPANATNKTLTWASSAPTVAAVQGNGATVSVVPLEPGTATITAASPDGPSASCAVQVEASPISLPPTLGMGLGRSAALTAVITIGTMGEDVAWASSAPGVVSVAGTGPVGILTAREFGRAAITATTQDGGHTATCEVAVAPLSQLNDPSIFMAGLYGLYVDGRYDYAYNGQKLRDVVVGPDGSVHVVGQLYDPYAEVQWEAVYYRNAAPMILPRDLVDDMECGAIAMSLAPGGDAYIVGYEYDRRGDYVARLWKVAPDGTATILPLEGIDETGRYPSSAMSVKWHDGSLYVAGGAYDDNWKPHPAIWKDQAKHEIPGHSFEGFVDMGFDADGTLHVLSSDYRAYTVAPEDGSSTLIPIDDSHSGINRLFVDETGVYACGRADGYACFWKNGQLRVLERPQDANIAEAFDIHVHDGHVYIAGCSGHGENYRIQLWIDGLLIQDDRTVEGWIEGAVATNALFVGRAARPSVQVASVTLDKAALSVAAGHTGTLAATVAPAGATNKALVWTSSDPAVATVTGRGQAVTVNGVAPGEAVVKATSLDGPSAACSVSVSAAPTIQATGLSLQQSLQ